MGRPNVNWNVGVAAEKQSTYTSKILKASIPFASQVTEPNTKYIIKYDYVLTDNVIIPSNCIFEFEGGSISGAYTLTGDNTIIEGRGYIFKSGVLFAGTFTIHDAKAEWFGVHPTNTDNAAYINAALKFVRSTQTRILTFNSGRYAVKNPITLGSDTDGESVNRYGWDIVIEGAGQGSSLPTSAGGGDWGTTFALSDDGYFFVNQLSAASGWGRSGAIRNCSFVGEEGTERGIIINQSFPYEISNCYFYGLGAAISVTGAAYFCNIFNCRFRSNDYCIKVLVSGEQYYDSNGANNNQIHNCTFQYNQNPLYIAPEAAEWHIYDCDFEPGNGTIYLCSMNTMDNVRIERNDVTKTWLQIGSNNKLTRVYIHSAGTSVNNTRLLIDGTNNDCELYISGHNVKSIEDYGGNNKINLIQWNPATTCFIAVPADDDITILGVNNKLPTKQGANLVTSASQGGGTLGYSEIYPGIRTMTTYTGRSFDSTEPGKFGVIIQNVGPGDTIKFNNTIDYKNPFDTYKHIMCIMVNREETLTRVLCGNTSQTSNNVFCSISKDVPCFFNAGTSNVKTIEVGPDYTDIYLNALQPIYCFGCKPDGASRNPSFSPAARFWYNGIRYVCYVDGLDFKFHPFDSGTTDQRPTAQYIDVGFRYFDTTLEKPIFAKAISGSTITWVDAAGTIV